MMKISRERGTQTVLKQCPTCDNRNDNSRRSTSTHIEVIPSEASLWETTPAEILVNVFSRLNDSDLFHASLVCKTWSEAFGHSSVWRSRCFTFEGNISDQNSTRYRNFLSCYGGHLRHVTLEFWRPNELTRSKIYAEFRAFVRSVLVTPGLRFQSLRIRSLNLYNGWRACPERRKLIRALVCLIGHQPQLKSVDFAYSQTSYLDGIKILECLAKYTTVSQLVLRNFFNQNVCKFGLKKDTFERSLEKFSALSFICLDQLCLNKSVLETLTNACRETLRKLELVVDADSNVLDQGISPRTWIDIAGRSPHLSVAVRFAGLCSYHQYSSVLVRNMPLSEVSMAWRGLERELHPALLMDVEELLIYISNIFYDTFTSLKLILSPEAEVSLDYALIDLVRKCPFLRDLRVTVKIQPETLQLIKIITSRIHSSKERFYMELNTSGSSEDLKSRDSLQMASRDSLHMASRDSLHMASRDSLPATSRKALQMASWDSTQMMTQDSLQIASANPLQVTSKDSLQMMSQDSWQVTSLDSLQTTSWDSFRMTSRDFLQMASPDSLQMTSCDFQHEASRSSMQTTSRDSRQVTSWDSLPTTSRHSSHEALIGSLPMAPEVPIQMATENSLPMGTEVSFQLTGDDDVPTTTQDTMHAEAGESSQMVPESSIHIPESNPLHTATGDSIQMTPQIYP